MNSALSSLFKKIISRFAILVFSLLLTESAAWLFFTREILLRAGIPEAKVLSSLVLTSRFMLVLIVILLVISVLLGLIFINGIRSGLFGLLQQLSRLKTAPIGARVSAVSQNELSGLANEINGIIQKLENEIVRDLQSAKEEHQRLADGQKKLSSEQQKIYEEKIKLDYILARATDGIILLSKNKNIVLLNKAAEELIGYKQAEAAGKPIGNVLKILVDNRQITPEEFAPAHFVTAQKEEAFSKKNIRIESAHATPKYADLICVRLTLIQAQDIAYMLLLHDLTARLEIEQKRTDMLASIASELTLPVNNLQSNNLPAFQSGIKHLSIILDNLRLASTLDLEKVFPVSTEKIDLPVITKKCIDALSQLAGQKKISINFTTPEGFSALVKADPLRLENCILNLLLNSINFSPVNTVIAITLSHTEKDTILQIQDTGIGIPTAAVKDLFTKFFVVPNDKGFENGIGIGLYICKKLIELQGGKIWLDSVEGRGTVASISLPKTN